MRYVGTFVLLFAVWLMWSGHSGPLLIGLGLGSTALVVWLSWRMRLIDAEAFPYHLTLRLLGYIPWVLWQVIKTNFSVAKIILDPKLPIFSHLIFLEVKQKTALGRVIHANTITITPGTVTLDVRDGYFVVHALTREAAQEDGINNLDDRVARLEAPRWEKVAPAPKATPPDEPHLPEPPTSQKAT
jgi:multicomponent Na+:H+ antiporter subunit E